MKHIDIYTGDSDYIFHDTKWKYIGLSDFKKGFLGVLSAFPSCCGYAIYKSIYSDEIEDCTKIFLEILEANKEEECGFGSIIATEVDEKRIVLLKENGWTEVHSFLNYGSGNQITTLVLTL